MIAKMTPVLEALYALDRDLPRSGVSMATQLAYDQLKSIWERGTPFDVRAFIGSDGVSAWCKVSRISMEARKGEPV